MSNDKKKKELARIIAGRMSPGAPQQIDAVRSTTGQIKGFLTKDTLYRLRQAVADHQKAARRERSASRAWRSSSVSATPISTTWAKKTPGPERRSRWLRT